MTPLAPVPPSKPPEPPAPPLGPSSVPARLPAPPAEPLTSIVPTMVTSPWARIVTGVFAALRVKRTVTPPGMFTVVKLKTPVAGSVSVRFADGFSAPSAPVLPLLNWACAGCDASTTLATTSAIEVRITRSSCASRDREHVAAGAGGGRRAGGRHDAHHPGAGGRAGGDSPVGGHLGSRGVRAEGC